MHRKIPISNLLYNYLYPRPSSNDPNNFSGHLSRYLIPEIRIETNLYFGDLSTIEARYPGLNYTYPPHIRRLSRFPHHARLFRAVKALGITDTEILDLARWEGTLWARERYEKDEGIKVLDTTGDEIPSWTDPRRSKSVSKIRATTTTTFVSTPDPALVSSFPTSTPCELEVREPEIRLAAESPVESDDDDDDLPESDRVVATQAVESLVIDGDRPASGIETEVTVEESDPEDAPPSEIGTSELSRHILEAILHQQLPEDRTNLPSELRVVILELVEILRLNRTLSADEFSGIRRYITRRVDELRAHLPPASSVNIVSAITMLLEQRLQHPLRTSDAAPTQTQTAPAISQPAA